MKSTKLLLLMIAFALSAAEISLPITGDVSLYKTAKETQAYINAKGESPVSPEQSYLACGVFGC